MGQILKLQFQHTLYQEYLCMLAKKTPLKSENFHTEVSVWRQTVADWKKTLWGNRLLFPTKPAAKKEGSRKSACLGEHVVLWVTAGVHRREKHTGGVCPSKKSLVPSCMMTILSGIHRCHLSNTMTWKGKTCFLSTAEDSVPEPSVTLLLRSGPHVFHSPVAFLVFFRAVSFFSPVPHASLTLPHTAWRRCLHVISQVL